MTSRLSDVDVDAFDDDERALYAEVTSGRFNPTGPTAIWSRSPSLCRAALDFGSYIRWDSVLDPALRELAILVTATALGSENEWIAHEPQAREAGVAEEVIAAVRSGAEPSAAPRDQSAVIDFARTLHAEQDVDDARYAAVSELLGDRGVVDLVTTIGFYTMIAMLLTSTRAPLTRRAKAPDEGTS